MHRLPNPNTSLPPRRRPAPRTIGLRGLVLLGILVLGGAFAACGDRSIEPPMTRSDASGEPTGDGSSDPEPGSGSPSSSGTTTPGGGSSTSDTRPDTASLRPHPGGTAAGTRFSVHTPDAPPAATGTRFRARPADGVRGDLAPEQP
ncbi:MAG: hypothetical protein EA398_15160 [Deltaproteobacteria bacterium]|nr:MAG: hypothetical protein EA398_15160 [Deltaproteobacteria bacterium]